MGILHPLSTSEWLKQASAALKSGDSARAYECAMAAVRQDPLCEQAWLILASLSEPEKAMLYLENALRANPRSQVARKAVRLVFSRLNAADSAGTSDEPGDEPNPAFVDVQTPLEEEEPILEKPAEKVEEDTSEETQSMQENLPQDAKISVVSPEKTAGALRLRKRSESVVLPPTFRGRKFKLVRKAKPASVFPESPVKSFAGQPAVELGASPIAEAAVEPPAISTELAAAGANEPDSIQTPLKVVEVEQSPSPEMPAGQHPSPAKGKRSRKPTPLPAPEQLPARSKKKRTQKIAADRPVIMPDSASASTPRGFHVFELKKTEPADVDMIELVLVSIAAIVLPLIVFLYFYLSR